MPRTTARRISVALMLIAVLALPVRPAAAAGLANPLAPASRSVDRLWSWLTDFWVNGVAASKRPAAGRRQPSALIGKLGGFLDPDGARLVPTTGTVINH
ncbi:MAG TPA: hypothetical protein VFE33_09855 [Thermoanaerobaculia bacterium]|nr:hypothetical protein [Thermoanaerobaculia bacterium]